MEEQLKDRFGIEQSVLYMQNLNRMLSRVSESVEKDPGSLVMIEINKQGHDYKANLEKALESLNKYDFDNKGNIKDSEETNLWFVAHKLKDTKESVDKTVVGIIDDLSKVYPKDKFRVVGMLYDGTVKITSDQAIEKLKSILGQMI